MCVSILHVHVLTVMYSAYKHKYYDGYDIHVHGQRNCKNGIKMASNFKPSDISWIV